ncbi:MAG TPA: hypothetical protein VEW03_15160, partial [Longimicrobiaceae bacterium]|nr:hypothetical protein [Longimicrobiaceae bacterium]
MIIPECKRLLDEASLHERAGEWDAAARDFDSAFSACVAARSLPSLLEVIVKQGHSFRQAGKDELASELLEL